MFILLPKPYPAIFDRRKYRSFKWSGVSSHISVGTNAPVFPFNYFTRSITCRLYTSHQACHKLLLIFSSQNCDMIEISDVQISDSVHKFLFCFFSEKMTDILDIDRATKSEFGTQ